MAASSTDRGLPRAIAGRGGPGGKRHPKHGGGVAGAGGRTVGVLHLNTAAVAGIVGIDQEVALLRAAIRRLIKDDNGEARDGEARDGEAGEAEALEAEARVEALVELRHQVDSLCTALKTQRALDGRPDDAVSTAVARALELLGDEMGVPK
jgi:hypothetical protein